MLPLCSSGCADGPGPGTAPGGDAPDQQVFPEAFWGLDPLFWLHVKLFIADILALQRHPRGPDIFFYGNHPIRYVEIMGIIRSIDRTSNLVVYSVDDGSATIPCAHWQNVSPLLELGTLVRMSGKVGQWRDQWQITVYNIDAIDDLNTEMLHWLEILSLKRAVYDKPFVLPPAMQEKATELEQSLSVTDLADDVGKARFDFDALDPSETNEAAFKQAIMQHVEDSGMTEFLYTAMRSSPEMENRAKKVLLYQRNVATPNRQHISSVFQHGIGSLVKEGLLIVKDVERDMYEVVRDELNLGPVLMRIIREATDNRILKPGGVQLDYILDMLSITEPFHKIPRQVAMKTLRWLESNSDIYQIGLREYKCL